MCVSCGIVQISIPVVPDSLSLDASKPLTRPICHVRVSEIASRDGLEVPTSRQGTEVQCVTARGKFSLSPTMTLSSRLWLQPNLGNCHPGRLGFRSGGSDAAEVTPDDVPRLDIKCGGRVNEALRKLATIYRLEQLPPICRPRRDGFCRQSALLCESPRNLIAPRVCPVNGTAERAALGLAVRIKAAGSQERLAQV